MGSSNLYIILLLIKLSLISSAYSQSKDQLKVDSLGLKVTEQIRLLDTDNKVSIDAVIDNTNLLNTLDPTEAIFYIDQLKDRVAPYNIPKEKGKILVIKGNYYWGVGIYNIALNNYFEALSIFEKSKDTTNLIRVLNNIGETYKKQTKYVLAEQFLTLALRYQTEYHTTSALSLIKVNIAQLMLLSNELDSSNKILTRIIGDTTKNPFKKELGYAYLYKGIIHKKRNEFDSAKFFINKAIQVWMELSLRRDLSEAYTELADLYFLEKDYANTKIILSKAQSLATSSQALDILMRIYQSRIALIERDIASDSLSYYYGRYIAVKDSIYNEASRKEINKLTIQYNLSEKEKSYYKLALEQQTLENQNQNQRALLVILGILLLLLIISFLLQYSKSKQLNAAHHHLTVQKAEIEVKQRQLSEKSLQLAKLNKELYNLNNVLEQKVIDRSAQLNVKNKQIAEYTFYNSHKLRAPVASILGLINVMELNKEGKVDASLLVHLKSCAQELDGVIHKLKVLLDTELKVESGKSD